MPVREATQGERSLAAARMIDLYKHMLDDAPAEK
jgi:hypothetical protein